MGDRQRKRQSYPVREPALPSLPSPSPLPRAPRAGVEGSTYESDAAVSLEQKPFALVYLRSTARGREKNAVSPRKCHETNRGMSERGREANGRGEEVAPTGEILGPHALHNSEGLGGMHGGRNEYMAAMLHQVAFGRSVCHLVTNLILVTFLLPPR